MARRWLRSPAGCAGPDPERSGRGRPPSACWRPARHRTSTRRRIAAGDPRQVVSAFHRVEPIAAVARKDQRAVEDRDGHRRRRSLAATAVVADGDEQAADAERGARRELDACLERGDRPRTPVAVPSTTSWPSPTRIESRPSNPAPLPAIRMRFDTRSNGLGCRISMFIRRAPCAEPPGPNISRPTGPGQFDSRCSRNGNPQPPALVGGTGTGENGWPRPFPSFFPTIPAVRFLPVRPDRRSPPAFPSRSPRRPSPTRSTATCATLPIRSAMTGRSRSSPATTRGRWS